MCANLLVVLGQGTAVACSFQRLYDYTELVNTAALCQYVCLAEMGSRASCICVCKTTDLLMLQAGMEYDGMSEDVDRMDIDSPRPQDPEHSPGVSPMPSTNSDETYHGCPSDTDSHSSNDTQNDEHCMENMMSDDDLADEEQQTAEELREELREETGTINSPTRYKPAG